MAERRRGELPPPHLLPFAQDLGEGELLIEFGQPTERIFYWDSDAHDWGSGVTRLAYVAENLYDFIHNLKPDAEATPRL